jgi:hypothetical protein
MVRSYQPRENKLLNEWVTLNYPNNLQWRRVRLGAIPGTPQEILYEGLRRWADKIILDNGTIIIIEAKMRPEPHGMAELEIYKKLFPDTPEFTSYKDLPIRLIFLTTMTDQTVADLCKEKGIELVIFKPSWVDEYWAEKMARF